MYKYQFLCFTGHAIGRDAFLIGEVIVPMSKLFDDKEDIVRKNAHKAIETISETHPGNHPKYSSFPLRTSL